MRHDHRFGIVEAPLRSSPPTAARPYP
jgi:hypothetical protein